MWPKYTHSDISEQHKSSQIIVCFCTLPYMYIKHVPSEIVQPFIYKSVFVKFSRKVIKETILVSILPIYPYYWVRLCCHKRQKKKKVEVLIFFIFYFIKLSQIALNSIQNCNWSFRPLDVRAESCFLQHPLWGKCINCKYLPRILRPLFIIILMTGY